MKMLVCPICGTVFTKLEAERRTHISGERYDDIEYLCPICDNENLEEATKCEICGEYFYDEDNTGVCDECFEANEDVGTALEYGSYNTELLEINGLISKLLGKKLINEILTKYVEEHYTDNSKRIVRYCEEDKSHFAEWLKEGKG